MKTWPPAFDVLKNKATTLSVFMHLAAFTAKDEHATWLRGHFISEQRGRKTWSKNEEVFQRRGGIRNGQAAFI